MRRLTGDEMTRLDILAIRLGRSENKMDREDEELLCHLLAYTRLVQKKLRVIKDAVNIGVEV